MVRPACEKPAASIALKTVKPEGFSSETRNQAGTPGLATLVRHSVGNPSQSSWQEKERKGLQIGEVNGLCS